MGANIIVSLCTSPPPKHGQDMIASLRRLEDTNEAKLEVVQATEIGVQTSNDDDVLGFTNPDAIEVSAIKLEVVGTSLDLSQVQAGGGANSLASNGDADSRVCNG